MRLFVNEDRKRNEIAYWDGGPDSKHIWYKNRLVYGKNWYYYKKNEKHISYIRNEFGFRERPLAEIDWKNSIILFGCSVVEGIGNTLEDTIAKQLEQLLDIPVLNFGISGSGIDLSCVNSLILHNDYPTPKAVVQMWSGLGRYSNFLTSTESKNYHPTREDYKAEYIWEERNRYYVEADRTLWKDKTVYYEGSTFLQTARDLNVTFYDELDKGRDQDHPGPKTNKSIAEDIAENLKKQGL